MFIDLELRSIVHNGRAIKCTFKGYLFFVETVQDSHPLISISVSAPAWGGTVPWMAPELFDGESRPSKESDIYALGMVIFEVCHLVFPGEPALIGHPVGLRTQTAVLLCSSLRRNWADPRRTAALAANGPGDSWPVRESLGRDGEVLGPGPKRSTSHHGYLGHPRGCRSRLGSSNFRRDHRPLSQPTPQPRLFHDRIY